MTIAEKLGGWILNILTFASNRTRRDDTWVDEDEYEDDEEYEDENHGKQHESRRARILRGALARRKRLAEKFINPMGRQTDAALFSGKRMDDEEEITYTARGVAADPDDVLFSGNRATQPEYDEYDPLLNGAPITEPVAVAAAATTATQSWAAPVEPVTQTPPVASVDVPPTQPTVAWQPVPGPQTGEPVIAPAPEGYPQQSQYAQPAVQYNEPLQQPVQPQQPYYAPAAEQPAQQPYYAPAPEQPVAGNAWQAEEQQSTFAPQSTYQTEQTYQQPAAQEPLYQQPQPVEQQPVVEPEPVVEETKPARPPLYYFEEVEEKRAREREQLAAWYQPIPEPVKEPEPIKSSLKAPSGCSSTSSRSRCRCFSAGIWCEKSDTGDGGCRNRCRASLQSGK